MENIKYASITKRGIAFFIDDIITSLLFIVIFYDQITKLTTPEAMSAFVVEYSWVVFVLKILYHTFFIGLNGATIGKYIVKIRAVDENNPFQTISWPMAFIRAVIREIGEMLFYITFIFAFASPKNQTLHDKISKCVVIDVK